MLLPDSLSPHRNSTARMLDLYMIYLPRYTSTRPRMDGSTVQNVSGKAHLFGLQYCFDESEVVWCTSNIQIYVCPYANVVIIRLV